MHLTMSIAHPYSRKNMYHQSFDVFQSFGIWNFIVSYHPHYIIMIKSATLQRDLMVFLRMAVLAARRRCLSTDSSRVAKKFSTWSFEKYLSNSLSITMVMTIMMKMKMVLSTDSFRVAKKFSTWGLTIWRLWRWRWRWCHWRWRWEWELSFKGLLPRGQQVFNLGGVQLFNFSPFPFRGMCCSWKVIFFSKSAVGPLPIVRLYPSHFYKVMMVMKMVVFQEAALFIISIQMEIVVVVLKSWICSISAVRPPRIVQLSHVTFSLFTPKSRNDDDDDDGCLSRGNPSSL